jgi:hypothetical protein
MWGPKKPEDVEPGTVLEDMHNSPLGHGGDWWDNLIEGYELSDVVKWNVSPEQEQEFRFTFLKIAAEEAGIDEQTMRYKYTNKYLMVFQTALEGSFKCFWSYDGTTVGVAKLSPKKGV